MDHVRYLAETIGPRGSTRPPESRAAEYAEKVLREAGLEPVTEKFRSGRSTYYPFALFSGLVLLSVVLFWWGGRRGAAAAALITLASLVSVLLELAFRPNPFRWLLPKGQSQNVWARIEPKQEARENAVLIGHLDTHRTPLLFAERWVRLLGNLVPAAMGACILLLALFIARIFLTSPVLDYIAIPLAAVILGLFLLMMQADFTPFAPGANDNATGVGVVLETARTLRSEPLENTRVWILASGCEEVGCYGAEAFAVRHKAELNRPVWLSVDSVGGVGTGVTYLTDETFLLTTRSDPRLLENAAEIARANPLLNAHPHVYKGAYTEGAVGGKHGFRVLSFVNCRRDGALPEWHRPTDTTGHVDPAVVKNTFQFVQQLLRRIDAGADKRAGQPPTV
jgi:hypothetical protein